MLAEIKVHQHGYVRYVDHMGTDIRICEAARVSYRAGSKGPESDKKLIKYLLLNHHCYHGDMQVLTARGWVCWKDCRDHETYIVPNPETKQLTYEYLKTERFPYNGDMVTFVNNRMSFSVTPNHRMLFKGLYRSQYDIYEASTCSKWGHFMPMRGFSFGEPIEPCPYYQLLGFFLGDGSAENEKFKTISFHLKRKRKIKYLRQLLQETEIEFTQYPSSQPGCVLIRFRLPREIAACTNFGATAKDKQLNVCLSELTNNQKAGLFWGLVHSDGSIVKGRPQIDFGSTSTHLVKLFQDLAPIVGRDGHYIKPTPDLEYATAYDSHRTSLESMKCYWGEERYTGITYCTTTSTGMLLVRGGPDKFAFVCGNTSPFEMAKMTFNVKLPIFVMRQWVRHRMQNLNEVSARYTELPDDFFCPQVWRAQDTKNRQGSVADSTLDHNRASSIATTAFKFCYAKYQELLKMGIARELARIILPVGIYTEIYCCWDLNNLLKFFSLRDDAHAQSEIQDYARAMKEMARRQFPMVMEVYEERRVREAIKVRAVELLAEYNLIDDLATPLPDDLAPGAETPIPVWNAKRAELAQLVTDARDHGLVP